MNIKCYCYDEIMGEVKELRVYTKKNLPDEYELGCHDVKLTLEAFRDQAFKKIDSPGDIFTFHIPPDENTELVVNKKGCWLRSRRQV